MKRAGKPDPYAYVPLEFKSLNRRWVNGPSDSGENSPDSRNCFSMPQSSDAKILELSLFGNVTFSIRFLLWKNYYSYDTNLCDRFAKAHLFARFDPYVFMVCFAGSIG